MSYGNHHQCTLMLLDHTIVADVVGLASAMLAAYKLARQYNQRVVVWVRNEIVWTEGAPWRVV